MKKKVLASFLAFLITLGSLSAMPVLMASAAEDPNGPNYTEPTETPDITVIQALVKGIVSAYDMGRTATLGDHEGDHVQSDVDTIYAAAQAAGSAFDNPTNESLQAALTTLNNAIAAFQNSAVKVDRTRLSSLTTTASRYISTNYTTDSWQAFSPVYAAAQQVLAGKPSQAEIDSAYQALVTAVTSLHRAANKAALKTAIDRAVAVDTSKYVADSVAAFQSTLASAQAVYADGNATQAAVDTATTELTTATVNLKLNTTTASINSLSKILKGIDLSKYSPESIQLILNMLGRK